MVCRLCLQEKELIKAHVIPRFLFKDIFSGNKIYETSFNNLSQRTVEQDAAYDYSMLCTDCDSLIGKYETYAANTIYRKGPRNYEVINQREFDTIIIKDIDYKKFKLFLLSNLWRSSVTQNKMFKSISLGKVHEERLRLMILHSKPGDVDEYPCLIFRFSDQVNRYTRTICSPKKIKSDLNTSYFFLVNNYSYWYNISPVNINEFIMKTAIDTNNELLITILSGKTAEDIIDGFYGFKFQKTREGII